MASAATTRPTFSFHLISQQLVSSHSLPRTRFHFSIPPQPSISLYNNPQRATHFALSSIDVSKEDKPPAPDAQITEPVVQQDESSSSSFLTEGEEETGQQFDKRRLEEKFAVLNTGVYECRSCGYKYDEAVGDQSYPVPPGLPFDKLPEDWRCPTCGAAQSFFQSKSVEIAGFAQNQQYGLGGNTLTSGQKAILIYGSLLLFFALFLSGYFLSQ